MDTIVKKRTTHFKRPHKFNLNKMSFKNQIEEDIDLIQEQWSDFNPLLSKRPYAFNHWVLNRIYEVDEELISDLITDYNDKSIDCYAHHEDSKELYIIQNKYYDDSSAIDRGDVVDFLDSPLTHLVNNQYKKSKELQRIFNKAKSDPDYQIFFHFYVTNNKKNTDAALTISGFNNHKKFPISPLLRANIFYLDDIKRKCYIEESFVNKTSFKFTLSTKVAKNILRIDPENYNMPKMTKAFYVLTSIAQLHEMNIQATAKNYSLYEDNIRDYLGRSPINNGIIQTLKNPDDRSNFFYYNNGVTIICDEIKSDGTNKIELIKPQIINGCQTVNSISEVLNDCVDAQEITDQFKDVFVMVKVLEYDAKAQANKPSFYKDIVKYTNKQNAINENAFGAKKTIFEKLQKELKLRGFLLLIRPSDKKTFSVEYSQLKQLKPLLTKAEKFTSKVSISCRNVSDVTIPLEKLLQVYLAFMKDGYYAYTKKNLVLKPTSDIYKDYSILMSQNMRIDNLIWIYLIYQKAELKRAQSIDKKTPIPYYVIGFFGRSIYDKEKANDFIKELFGNKHYLFDSLFSYFDDLTQSYKNEYFKLHGTDYNTMIKKQIDNNILDDQIDLQNRMTLKYLHPELGSYLLSLA
jgi:AIPR protein